MLPKESFGQYGKHFQECVVQALLVDRTFAEQMLEVMDVSYFELRYLSFLAERYFAYARKYKVFPTFQLLVTIVRDELKVGTDAIIRDQIIEYLTRTRAHPNTEDLAYVKDKALDFCRKQALKQALTAAVDLIGNEKYEQVVEGIKKAVTVGTTPLLGHDFFIDQESRFSTIQRNCVATGIDPLDVKGVLNGGLSAGELGCVTAPTGVGKSHFLVSLGCAAMRAGVNVLHYTFELSEELTGLRYDSNLCDVDSDLIIENKEKVIAAEKEMKLGRLLIKYFPTNTASIYTLRSHMERCDAKGFKPGIVLIDYADIMRSTRQYDSPRHELKLIYEELRGMAGERHLPVWTASQSNREGASSDVVDLTNMSEAYGKAMVCDVVISLSRKTHEKATGDGRMYVAKNRAGRDGIVWPVLINTARSKFAVSGNQLSFGSAQTDDQNDVKKRLREKFAELKNDAVLRKASAPVVTPPVQEIVTTIIERATTQGVG